MKQKQSGLRWANRIFAYGAVLTLIFVSAFMLAFMPVPCMGAKKALELHMEGSCVKNTDLVIYLNDSSGKKAKQKEFAVTLANKELTVQKVTSFRDTKEGVAYMFLVDVSGSITGEKLQEMKDYMKNIVRNMRPADEVCVATLGNEISVGKFVKGKDKIQKQIDAIEGLNDDTNLYYGISESLKLLDSDTHGLKKKALVVLSDGHDEQMTGITRGELNQSIKEKNIPIYTVAMLSSADSTQKQEFAKILGSFARISAGGFHSVYGVEELSMEKSAKRIVSSVLSGYLLTADISDYQPGNGQAYLQVSLKIKGVGNASVGENISEQELFASLEAKKRADAAKDTEKKKETAKKEDSGEKNRLPVPILIAAAVLLLLLLAVFIVKQGRKKEGAVQEDLDGQPMPVFSPTEAKSEDSKSSVQSFQHLGQPNAARIPDRIVHLAKIGMSESKTYEIAITGKVTVGRLAAQSDYAFPEDPRMSAVHCVLYCQGDKLLIEDAGSKNGTRVNGIPIMGPYVLKSDDIINIGQTELRIYW